MNIELQTSLKNKKDLQWLSKVHKKLQAQQKVFDDFILSLAAFRGIKAPRLGFEIDLTICAHTKMKSLNTLHRHKKSSTDVLSFPLYQNLRKKKLKEEIFLPLNALGDIVICLPKVKSQANEAKHSNEREFFQLFVHGFLHLLGFDHEISPREEKIMFDLEKKILEKIARN